MKILILCFAFFAFAASVTFDKVSDTSKVALIDSVKVVKTLTIKHTFKDTVKLVKNDTTVKFDTLRVVVKPIVKK